MGLWFTKSACLACAKSCAHTWKSGYPDTPKHITHGWSYQKHKDISYRIYEINGQFLFPVWGANWQGRRTRRKKLREVCIEEKKTSLWGIRFYASIGWAKWLSAQQHITQQCEQGRTRTCANEVVKTEKTFSCWIAKHTGQWRSAKGQI